jgi:hypothetical protein
MVGNKVETEPIHAALSLPISCGTLFVRTVSNPDLGFWARQLLSK